MAKNEGMEKHEEFKAEFKKRVKEQAKMLYRKSLDEISDRHKFVCVAYAVKDIVIDQWIATQKAYDCILFINGISYGPCSWKYDYQSFKQR